MTPREVVTAVLTQFGQAPDSQLAEALETAVSVYGADCACAGYDTGKAEADELSWHQGYDQGYDAGRADSIPEDDR